MVSLPGLGVWLAGWAGPSREGWSLRLALALSASRARKRQSLNAHDEKLDDIPVVGLGLALEGS